MRFKTFALTAALVAETWAHSCLYPSIPVGSTNGTSFNQTSELAALPSDMLVSQATVCVDGFSNLAGMQLTLADSHNSTQLSPVGKTDNTTQCQQFAVNTTSDYLQSVSIAYNVTGVYGLTLMTA